MKLSDNYYTGREVQKLLGVNEPRLRTLVANNKLTKFYPPGRKTAVYLKTEVDTFAEQWEAFLLAKEPPRVTFEIAQLADMEGVTELSRRAIGPTMDATVRSAWLKKNPETCYVVKHGSKVMAFFHLLPLKHDCLTQFMEGKIRGWNITGDDVETYEPGKTVECLLIIASEPSVNDVTRSHYMLVLIRGIMEEMKKLGQRGIIITKVRATSETPTGIASALHLGMEETKPRLGKRLRFELDVQKSDSFFVKKYKQGLAEWQESQSSNNHNNRKSSR